MDLTLTQEQRLLVDTARGLLGQRCPPAHVRAMEADALGFDPELWREMGRLGWLGMSVSRSMLEIALLLEEMGRVLFPSPFLPSVVLAGSLIESLGSEEQKARWMPAIASGELVATVAWAEPGGRDEWSAVAMPMFERNGRLTATGRKRHVPFAASADLLLVPVWLEAEEIAVAALPRLTNGLELRRESTLGGDPLYDAYFTDVRVSLDALLASSDAVEPALDQARARAAVASMAFQVGAGERVVEMTVEHARVRTQFGRPIGSFQAVAHRCVDMLADLDALRLLERQAAWVLGTGVDATLEASAAKAYGNDALERFYRHAHQIHGAIGFSTEHDLQLFTRRAKASEHTWGSSDRHLERVARAMDL